MPKRVALEEIEHTHGRLQLINAHTRLQLKEGSSIVLIPQPNLKDPNDPLRWPLVKKQAAFQSILFLSALCNFSLTGIGPGFGQIAEEFGSTPSELTWLIAAPQLGQALGAYTIAPLASKFGKRPIWLGCAFVFLLCQIWASVSKSYGSLLAARFMSAWACNPSEPLSIDTTSDIFFLHERATQAAIQTVWLTFGACFAPVISGFLIQAKGWRWYHWLCSIMAGLAFLLILFFVPETQYRRDLHESLEVAGADTEVVVRDEELPTTDEIADKEIQFPISSEDSGSGSETVPKKTFWQDLKLWNSVNKEATLLGALCRPWATFAFPSMVWCVLSYGLHVGGITVLSEVVSIYLSGPAYNFAPDAQGLTWISAVIGCLGAAFLCGYPNDWFVQRLTRRNGGVFKPEMRLPGMIIPLIITPAGLLMFGIGFGKEAAWIVPVLGFGLITSGIPAAGAVLQPYLIDNYPAVVPDCLITFNGMKQFITFGLGFGVQPWVDRDGIIAVFCIFAGLIVLVDSCAIILYFYGQRLRGRDARLKLFIF